MTAVPTTLNVYEECKLLGGVEIVELNSEFKQVFNQFIENYAFGLQDVTYDPQDEPKCREEISNAQETLGAYKILTETSFEQFDKLTCLSDFSGLPDISCTSFQDNPREKGYSTPTELVPLKIVVSDNN
jgi:hypothetical protein